jgi:hypothetical protein
MKSVKELNLKYNKFKKVTVHYIVNQNILKLK